MVIFWEMKLRLNFIITIFFFSIHYHCLSPLPRVVVPHAQDILDLEQVGCEVAVDKHRHLVLERNLHNTTQRSHSKGHMLDAAQAS